MMMVCKRRRITTDCSITWAAWLFLLCPICSARDTITFDTPLDDALVESNLVSAGGKFELGFFTPEGGSSLHGRYVGIWYHRQSPRTYVWVANREAPVVYSAGRFALQDGNLQVFGGKSGKPLWSTKIIKKSNSLNLAAKLMDSGNLVLLSDGGGDLSAVNNIVWQSFQQPTDTFIPGMMLDESLELKSWKAKDDPGSGDFTFSLAEEDQYLGTGSGNYQLIIKRKSFPYWKSGVPGKFSSPAEIPPAIMDYLLANFTSRHAGPKKYYTRPIPRYQNNNLRLLLNYTGELMLLTWVEEKQQWNLLFSQPRNWCSVLNACGSFGSCNSDNWPLVCNCLPGFEPRFTKNWEAGDFSGGCLRKSTICSQNETFLSLKIMKVGNPDEPFKVESEMECRNACLNISSCQCQAYSYSKPTRNSASSLCWTWLGDLKNLEEQYGYEGYNLSARVDLGSTAKDCKACGTFMIPYPLSTGPNCGDPMYFRFKCDKSTGQFSFMGTNGSLFRVIRISPSTRQFVIQAKNVDNCNHTNTIKSQQLNLSLPFKMISWCNADLGKLDYEVPSKLTNAVELGWELPPEPTCIASADCTDWPHSTCTPDKDGRKRCLCNVNFQWNGLNSNCTQDGNIQQELETKSRRTPSSWIVVVVAVLTSVIFLACIVSIYIWRRKVNKRQDKINRAQLDSERRIQDQLMDTSEFRDEDEKGIDVPFFDSQSILEATDHFSISNKLGQGGYGPVYKGMFLGGQEIAVNRLSRVSGQGLQEFKNVVVLIAKLQHRNLVRLKGYCIKGEEKILLYEYMPNKSLDSFIFDDTKSMILNWEMRFNIILVIARGLLSLHQDSRLRIIHRDLNTSNILLDEEMNPKISDFGLARIVGGKQTESNTNTVVGTYGYMSPEYALDGTFSVKSDVFSFGVVLLEIISGKKNTGFYQSKQTFSLINYAWSLWTENKVLDLRDKNLDESCNESEFIKFVNVGLLCVQRRPRRSSYHVECHHHA